MKTEKEIKEMIELCEDDLKSGKLSKEEYSDTTISKEILEWVLIDPKNKVENATNFQLVKQIVWNTGTRVQKLSAKLKDYSEDKDRKKNWKKKSNALSDFIGTNQNNKKSTIGDNFFKMRESKIGDNFFKMGESNNNDNFFGGKKNDRKNNRKSSSI